MAPHSFVQASNRPKTPPRTYAFVSKSVKNTMYQTYNKIKLRGANVATFPCGLNNYLLPSEDSLRESKLIASTAFETGSADDRKGVG